VDLIAPPDVTNHADDAPDADAEVFDDPTTNPRAIEMLRWAVRPPTG
jgi:hypothetical protein